MDYNFFKQMLIFSILNIFWICAYGKKGNCFRKIRQGNKYSNEVYCCINYEKNNGTCTACENGFFSKDGGACIPCMKNTYGDKCVHFCRCKEDQICNHIVGCTDLQSTRIRTTLKDSTVLYLLISTSGTEIGEETKTESTHGTGLVNQHIVMYTVCIGGLLTVITICYICVNLFRSKATNRTHQYHKRQHSIQNSQTLVLPIQKDIIDIESIYDEVDVISVLDNISLPGKHTNISNEPSSADNSEVEHESLKNDEYLNPYQPIVPDYEKHGYSTVTEYCNKINENGTGHQQNEEILFESELNTNDYNTSSTPSGFSDQVCKKNELGEIANIERNDYHGTSNHL